MKRLLMISGILSWFNIVIWGFFTVAITLFALATASLPLLGSAFIMSCVIFHGYAALQLRKSISNPALPLGRQIPLIVRFMGLMAFFLGILLISGGIKALMNLEEFVTSKDLESSLPHIDPKINIRTASIEMIVFFILIGVSMVGNAILGFGLLRDYFIARQEDQDLPK